MASPVCISLSATHLRATRDGRDLGQRPTTPADAGRFATWLQDYAGGTATSDRRSQIGRELYQWLDGADRLLGRYRDETPDALWLEFVLEAGGNRLFLDVSWELLRDEDGYLAEAEFLSFSVVRRLLPRREPPAASRYRPAMVFMAADPRGNAMPLDHDAEEQAILQAVHATGVDFLCEDTGNLEALARRIQEETEGDGGVDIVHLSCHGNLTDRPVLALETELGEPELVGAREIAEQFGEFRPRLLFLSACTTAQPDQLLGSLAGALALKGFPAVLGWAGKVSDVGATCFAAELYRRLAMRESLEAAVAQARKTLGRHGDREVKTEWHKARVFFGRRAAARSPAATGAATGTTPAARIRNSSTGSTSRSPSRRGMSLWAAAAPCRTSCVVCARTNPR